MVRVRSNSSLALRPSSTKLPNRPFSKSISSGRSLEAVEVAFVSSSVGICGRFIVMTKSVDFETNLIRVISTVVDVGSLGLPERLKGFVLARSVSAGVPCLL